MKVIIAGSRSIKSYSTIEEAIKLSAYKITEIVSGRARGVDRLGEEYARLNGIPVKLFPADWDTFGNQAGHMRNEEMGDYADALIAIWDGKSNGTKHMIQYMKKLEKPNFVFINLPVHGKSTVSKI